MRCLDSVWKFLLRGTHTITYISILSLILGVELTRPLATIFLQGLIEHFGQPDHGLKLLQEIQEKVSLIITFV